MRSVIKKGRERKGGGPFFFFFFLLLLGRQSFIQLHGCQSGMYRAGERGLVEEECSWGRFDVCVCL